MSFRGPDWDDYYEEYDDYDDGNDRYSNAYGDYRGGYGPPGSGFGPPGGFGPMGGFGPPRGPGPFGPPGFGPDFGPPGPPAMWGRGYGPEGPPSMRKKKQVNNSIVKYLLRCGMPREHLRNLPRDLLRLFESNHCALCDMSFDTFTISRMHYISKNHLKNQKKWLNQASEGGVHRAKEIPMKSRDLYCELCDVHITSKSHADSHYAGKQHRAIAEGKKKPKNPILLQRGMESRVEQLIRREKRNLKDLDKEPVVKNEEDEGKPKASQPELYCDICKTSVTCTEQMTMHLNGKRHLSKEKQHILKMMKGETNAEKQGDDYQEDDQEEAEDWDEENGDENGGEKGVQKEDGNGDKVEEQPEAAKDGGAGGDWGCGSEDW